MPKSANHRRGPFRRLVASAGLAGALILTGAACTGGEGDDGGAARSTTTTTVEGKGPGAQEKYTGKATETLLNTTQPMLNQIFETLMEDASCTEATVIGKGGNTESESSFMSESVTAIKQNTNLVMDRTIDAQTGEVIRISAHFYIPGDKLSAEERQQNTSSDNPEGNRVGNNVEVFQVLSQDTVRIDARGSDDNDYNGIFSTQGDIDNNGSYWQGYGDPLVAAGRAQAVTEEVANFVGLQYCLPDDPNIA